MNKNSKNESEAALNFSQAEQLYKNISFFTDTVVFEYSYMNKQFYLSPNAKGQFNESSFLNFFSKYKQNAPKNGEIQSVDFCLGQEGEPYHWCNCKLVALWDEQRNKPVKLVGKLQDITGGKAREKQLLLQSIKDGLTGVYNKMTVEYRIDEMLKKGSQGFICMIDIDNFKEINDCFGHPTGDWILKQVGKVLYNTYPEPDIIGRIGGDEFIIFTTNEDVKERSEKLLRMVEDIGPKKPCCLSVSVGIVPSSLNSDEDYQKLFHKADRAMYHAKQSGKNRIAFFDGLE